MRIFHIKQSLKEDFLNMIRVHFVQSGLTRHLASHFGYQAKPGVAAVDLVEPDRLLAQSRAVRSVGHLSVCAKSTRQMAFGKGGIASAPMPKRYSEIGRGAATRATPGLADIVLVRITTVLADLVGV